MGEQVTLKCSRNGRLQFLKALIIPASSPSVHLREWRNINLCLYQRVVVISLTPSIVGSDHVWPASCSKVHTLLLDRRLCRQPSCSPWSTDCCHHWTAAWISTP